MSLVFAIQVYIPVGTI